MNHNPTVKYKRLRVCFGVLNAIRSPLNAPRAFTLVELMVVVAIISILLMLLVPNIRAMREKAWSANCQNNLRQYGIAMNQYMSSGSWAAGGQAGGAFGLNTHEKRYTGGIVARGASSASSTLGPPIFYDIIQYIPGGVTIQSLSDAQASVRVCPAVLQQIKKDGNFFDPNSPNFKGNYEYTDEDGETCVAADFEAGWTPGTNLLNVSGTNSGYDAGGNLTLSSAFSTYAITPVWINRYKRDIPENVVAYMDWNARDGWGAYLGYTNWMFNGINGKGDAVRTGDAKWTNAWWLTEVGFHHFQSGVYGANYVAMDGHVGWVSSNAISVTNFTTGM